MRRCFNAAAPYHTAQRRSHPMKTLLFLRHGKSDWDADYERDHERPLAQRGRKAARQMGELLAQIGPLPDRIISSTAVRARDTAERAHQAGSWTASIETTERLYHASSSDLLDVIHAEADATTVLLLVGHEPTWSATVSRFIGGGDIRYPTAALARVDLDIGTWREAAFGKGQLVWLIPPRLLP